MAVRVQSGQLGLSTPFGELLGRSDAEMHAELRDYQSMGVSWIRTDIHWSLVQPTANGGFNWSLVDKVFNAAKQYGIEITAILNNNPPWVNKSLSSATDQQAFGKFAAAAAEHFQDRVKFWEILNEPNMHGISPSSYTEALKAAYAGIKAVDAGNTVITGGTAAIPSTGNGMWGAVDYLEQMYSAGAKGHFDAVGFHPYTFPLYPSDTQPWNGWQIMKDGIRGAMEANGDGNKQVWMTELGAPTAGIGPTMSQSQQAQILQQATDLAEGHSWAGPIMWYTYQDRGGSTNNAENWFGLVGPNGEKKQAYHTFKAIAMSDGNDSFAVLGASASSEDDADTFVFTDADSANVRIQDFQEGDKIDVSGIDANANAGGNQAFNFIGSNWLSKAADLGVYVDRGHNVTYVQGDTRGDGAYNFSIALEGVHSLNAGDFIL
jgi:hypothetical protein